MPAVSKKQQRFFGMVRAAQKGEGASSPEVAKVAASIKKKDAKDFASTKHKGLPEKKMKSFKEATYPSDFKNPDGSSRSVAKKKTGRPNAQGDYGKKDINEEDADRLRDRRMERGGVGGNQRYDRAPKAPNTKKFGTGKTALQKDMEKKHGKGKSAMDIVRAEIEAKHGKGALMKTKKEETEMQEGKKGLWDNIHAKRKRGEKPAKKGDKNYPETLNVEGYAPGDVDQKVGAVTAIPKKEQDDARARILAKTKAKRKAKLAKEEVIAERGDFWHPDPEKDRKLGGPGANQRAREDRAAASKPKSDPKKLRPGESYMDYAKRQKASKMKREGVEAKSFKEFLEEGNRTGRMMQKSKSQVTGHISADRGSDEKKNKEGRKTLEKDLKKHGIGHKKGVGEYKYGSGETGREVSYQTSKPDKMSKRRFGKVMRRLGRKHGQESVITKDKEKSAKLHYTEKGSKAKSDSIGKTKAGKHPEGYGETSGTKVRSKKLPKKTNKGSFHYG